MGSGQISANWRALQKKLQQESTANGSPLKRKRALGDSSGQQSTKKHKSLERAAGQKLGENLSNGKPMIKPVVEQRQRSESAPEKPTEASKDHGSVSLKPSRSTTDLDDSTESDHTNEGNSAANVAGKYVALDCEMVGIGPSPQTTSQLARVSIVNFHGHQIYDSFVLPELPVTDYRTSVSGITAALLAKGRPLEEVRDDVVTLLKGRVLVGHAVKNDLTVLKIDHAGSMIRDTAHHKPWRDEFSNGGIPSLRSLVQEILGWEEFQNGEHNSVEDAKAAMMLFRTAKGAFESALRRRAGPTIIKASSDSHHPNTGPEDADGDGHSKGTGTKSSRKKKKKSRR